ncbi:MAG: AAA family ATPase [Candidatus Accumulibacter sp.]|jgi:Mg-chelatase subunit ChlI/Mg-chelatase subunit ChlD|nr:AAA family ATPase [Accumulibacter sp.]
MSAPLPNFPFSALCGQTPLQTALLLAAIDPAIGGVLVEGARGTAKSTAARALADLLPQGRFVNLPLGASEEQLIGSLDIDHVLQRGEVVFKAGLLARAHEGVLYVDEINLLPDSLVDLLLDVTASGVNHVERDGVSHRHEARIVLVGTMNPEEGELRPQLLDRFGLCARVGDIADAATRRRIVRTRLEFDADPAAFVARHADAQRRLAARLENARAVFPTLSLTDAVIERVSELCQAAAVEGVRADLAMLRAARAHAALRGRSAIADADIDAVAELALAHRRHSRQDADAVPPPNGGAPGNGAGADKIPGGGTPNDGASGGNAPDAGPGAPSSSPSAAGDAPDDWGALPPDSAPPPIRRIQSTRPLPAIPARRSTPTPGVANVPAPSADAPRGPLRRGAQPTRRIHWPRTLFAKGDRPFAREYLRYRSGRAAGKLLHCLVLDCSASMLQGESLSLAKGLLLAWTARIYRQRAELAVVAFSGGAAYLVRPPAKAVAFNESWIRGLAGGGGTPVTRGLRLADEVLRRIRQRTPERRIGLWLLTDGRFAETPPRPAHADFCVVVDFESAAVPLRRASRLAAAWQSPWIPARAWAATP